MPRSSQTRMVWSPSAASVASMTSSSGWSRAMVTSSRAGLARLHAPGAFRSARKEAEVDSPPEAEVALYLTDPAGETAGISKRRPEVVDSGVEAVVDPHDALAIG